MITLEYHSLWLENTDNYRQLFIDVFEEWTEEGNVPSEVYFVYDDDKIVGFLSGYPMSKDMWYLQRTGYIKDEQYKAKNLQRTKEVMYQLNSHWPFIFSVIRNDDVTTLKIALSVGFKIIGTRVDTQHKLWVEMMYGENV